MAQYTHLLYGLTCSTANMYLSRKCHHTHVSLMLTALNDREQGKNGLVLPPPQIMQVWSDTQPWLDLEVYTWVDLRLPVTAQLIQCWLQIKHLGKLSNSMIQKGPNHD